MWPIREYYHHILGFTPDQVVLGRYILFNLTSIVDWNVVTARKKWKYDIDNFCKNAMQVRYDYEIGDLAYMEMTHIHRILYCKKQGLYIITEVIKNGTV